MPYLYQIIVLKVSKTNAREMGDNPEKSVTIYFIHTYAMFIFIYNQLRFNICIRRFVSYHNLSLVSNSILFI